MKTVIFCLFIIALNFEEFVPISNPTILNTWHGSIDYACKDISTRKLIKSRKNTVKYQFKNEVCIIDDTTSIPGFAPSVNHSVIKYKLQGDSIIWQSKFVGSNFYFELKGNDSLLLKGFDKDAECASFARLKKE